MIMNRHSILALALVSLVIFLLPFDVNADPFPTGAYKYTPAQASSGRSGGSSVPGNVSTPRFIQGDNDLEKMRNLSKNSLGYKLGRKVAIVYLGGGTDLKVFTGFLVGPDLLLTANHCLYSEKDFKQYPLRTASLRMDYYRNNQDISDSAVSGIKEVVKKSWDLDYALLRLDRPLGNTYGWLDISTRTPSRSTGVTIIQHPRGRPKEIDRSGAPITKVYRDAIHYTADTEGGSSGSPVFIANTSHLIALHHGGKPGLHNEGILMKKIYPEIKPFIQKSVKASQDLKITQESTQKAEQGAKKFELGQYDAAIKDFNAAIRLKPGYAELYFLRGMAKHKLGRNSEALQDLQTSLKLVEKTGDRVLKTENVKSWIEILGTATLNITSTPSGATVYINSTQVGTTQLNGYKVDTGQHGERRIKVELALNGYKRYSTNLTLVGGETKTWNGNLEKIPSPLININSVPNRAAVYIDGRKIGITPIRKHKVDIGTSGKKQVKIELALDGHERHTTNITLVAGESKDWYAALEKLPTPRKPERRPAPEPERRPAPEPERRPTPEPERRPTPTTTLDITSTPNGATVYIDGTNVGTTPLRGHKVDTGTRSEKQVKVSLELEGYKSRETQLTLKRGKSTPWNTELEKMPTQTESKIAVLEEKPEKMALIPAGKFRMGTDQTGSDNSKPIHTVNLDAFYIDTHEVTVGEYKEFLLDSGHPSSLHSEVYKYSPTDNHPIVGISWHDAMAYAKWANKRLPTEAEWEKAARGGLIDMRYPWGNEQIDSSKAHYGNLNVQTVPVGSYPPNAYGLYDMVGNTAEWCLDPWDSNFYANSPAENPFAGHKSREATIRDSKNVTGLRVVRSGSWDHTSSLIFWVSARFKYDAMKKPLNVGFRCVKDLP